MTTQVEDQWQVPMLPAPKIIYNPPKDVSNLAMAICILAIGSYFVIFPLTISTIPKTEHKGLIGVGVTLCIIHLVYLLVIYLGLQAFKRRSFPAEKLTLFEATLNSLNGDNSPSCSSQLGNVPIESLDSASTRLQIKIDDIKTLNDTLVRLGCLTIFAISCWISLLVYSIKAKSSIMKNGATVTNSIASGHDMAVEDRPGAAQELVGICGAQIGLLVLVVGLLIWEMVKLRKYTRFARVARDVAGYFV